MTSHSNPQVIVAQLGSRMHYAVPVVLHRSRMLARFFTDTYAGAYRRLSPLIKSIERYFPLLRRTEVARWLGRDADLPVEKVTSYNWLGFQYWKRLRQARTGRERGAVHLWAVKELNKRILANQSAISNATTFYAYNGASLELFLYGSQKGMKLVLDQIRPSLYEDRLVAEESLRWPGWEKEPWSVQEDEMFFREVAEWKLADTIIVNSDYSRNALMSLGVEPAKITVVPLAISESQFSAPKNHHENGTLRLLYLGTLTLRKGLQYALEAMRLVKSPNVTLTIVGKPDSSFDETKLQDFIGLYEYKGPLPRTQVVEAYRDADLFVFPTISDGFGLTQLEAMTCGLPVLATSHCGAVVRDGVDGFVIPIRDANALAERIDLLASNRSLLTWMSQNARKRAQDFSWEKYGDRLTAALTGSLGESGRHLLTES